MQSRCAKGIPDSMRAIAWPLLCDIEKIRQAAELKGFTFENLKSAPIKDEDEVQIQKDINRQRAEFNESNSKRLCLSLLFS